MATGKLQSRAKQMEEKDVKLIPYDPLTSTLSSDTSGEFLSFYQPFKSSKECFAIDVECVATGTSHDARAVAHVAIVDQWCRLILNVYVKPKTKVVSYLPDLTGLSKEVVDGGISLEACIALVKKVLPSSAILVGQSVTKDIEWLSLKEGVDFAGVIDLNGLWRVFHPSYKNYSYFSLHHKSKCLLGYDHVGPHHPITDALISMQLYNLYTQLEHYPSELNAAYSCLLQTPQSDSFSKKVDGIYEGVCMGQKKTCKCGDPFLY
jgi:RNA exonuclease 4